MPHTQLVDRWSSGQPAFGAWVTWNSPEAVESFARAGYDHVLFDTQHTLLSVADVGNLLSRLIGTQTAGFVRPEANIPSLINKFVDAGADGIVVPMVNSAAEAEAAVSAVRYAPRGTRSFGPMRAHMGYEPEGLEERVSMFVMIETTEAISNVEAICAVEGIAGVFIGPADLSLSLVGDPFAFRTGNETVLEAIGTVVETAKRAGVIAGTQGGSSTQRFVEMGFRFVMITSDIALVEEGASRQLQHARATGENA